MTKTAAPTQQPAFWTSVMGKSPLMVKKHSDSMFTYIHDGKFIDIRLEGDVWVAYETCAEGLAGFELFRKPSHEEALAAVLHPN